MNLYQFAASTNYERVNIYMLSKIAKITVVDFESLRLSYLFKDMEKPFIFTAIYQKRGGLGLYKYHKVYPIEDIAVVDNPRYSLFDVLKNKI